MTVVVLGEREETRELIARRRRLGHDRHDEVWEGADHVAPDPRVEHSLVQVAIVRRLDALARERGLVMTLTCTLGASPDDYRVPDFGLHDAQPRGVWVPTAAVVGEVLSLDDETWDKLPFYARRGVGEVWVLDEQARTVRVFLRQDDTGFDEADASPRMGLTTAELADLDWPA